jgi:2-polyprenyl-3-methyl-5-hydroxy-6-metoxy-1,4-benzoquinol methylase
MDLRKFNISPATADEAFSLLDYQPFVIDDDRYTGVAYSWLHTPDARLAGFSHEAFRFDRRTLPEEKYRLSFVDNRMLAATYDNFIDVVTRHVPGGTLLDVSCNNGYFPVLASLKGCTRAVGLDPFSGPYRKKSFDLLNSITGAKAEFLHGGYSFNHHVLYESEDGVNATVLEETFDIVTNSAFMFHTGEPLHFLWTLSRHVRKALLIYSGFTDDDDLTIRFNPAQNMEATFPNCFNDGTVMSTKLFRESMRLLGFKSVEQIAPPPSGIQDRTPLAGMPRYGIMKAFLCLR